MLSGFNHFQCVLLETQTQLSQRQSEDFCPHTCKYTSTLAAGEHSRILALSVCDLRDDGAPSLWSHVSTGGTITVLKAAIHNTQYD